MEKVGRHAPEIEDIVAAIGLIYLITYSMETDDKGLLYAFAERWYRETSSFHLFIGELSITLDDVASLLLLPIASSFFTYYSIDIEQAVELLVELLEVTKQEAIDEREQCRRAYVRLV